MRAIGSASGLTIAGLAFIDLFVPNNLYQYSTGTGTYKLCIDGLQLDTYAKLPGVFVHVGGNQKRFLIDRHIRIASYDCRFHYVAYDRNFKKLDMTDANKHLKSSGTQEVTSYAAYKDSSSTVNSKILTVADDSGIEYLFVGLGNGISQGISIRNVSDTLSTEGAVNVVLPWGNAGETQRQSYGTPTVGIFKKAGEYVGNINTASGQPVGWHVKTAGYLSPAWASSTAVILGEIRSNANKHYSADAAGTTGGTAPTHSSGSASDGTITWTHLGADAVLEGE